MVCDFTLVKKHARPTSKNFTAKQKVSDLNNISNSITVGGLQTYWLLKTLTSLSVCFITLNRITLARNRKTTPGRYFAPLTHNIIVLPILENKLLFSSNDY